MEKNVPKHQPVIVAGQNCGQTQHFQTSKNEAGSIFDLVSHSGRNRISLEGCSQTWLAGMVIFSPDFPSKASPLVGCFSDFLGHFPSMASCGTSSNPASPHQ